jgi:hypothetical protein
LTRLSGDWALWRTVCLRGAGFPVSLLADVGASALASAADIDNSGTVDLGTATAAYAAVVSRLSSVLYQIAGLPLLREAIAWQNRHALEFRRRRHHRILRAGGLVLDRRLGRRPGHPRRLGPP